MGTGVRFNLIEAEMPGQGDLAWAFYGGDDGSVLVFKPEKSRNKRWEKLGQTKTKDHGYWGVSIRRRQGNSYFQPDVQKVILFAFEGPPALGTMQAMHIDDNPDSNCLKNLKWGTKNENATSRHQNQVGRSEKQTNLLGTRISLECRPNLEPRTDGKVRKRTIVWVGELNSPAAEMISPLRTESTNPSHVVASLLDSFTRSTEHTPEKLKEPFDCGFISTDVGPMHIPVGFARVGLSYRVSLGVLIPKELQRTTPYLVP